MKRFVRMICWLFIAILLGSSDRAMAQPDRNFVSRLILSSGGAVGNGGGTIVCRNPDRSIRSIEVLDLFEARVLRKNPADLESFAGDWRAKVRAVIERLGKVSVLRENIYSDWLASFEEEAMVLEGVDFNNIPDTMNIGIPKGCEFVQVAVQIMPRFTGDHRYYLNGEYWRAMDDTQKAALVLHEIVYREALSYGHTDSVATRYFLGLIASPKILTEDSWSIIPTLKQVRFEQTDVPLEHADIDTEFNPVNWWRSFFDGEGRDPNRKEKPNVIPLNGRMVINVGVCRNSGCTDWVNYGAKRGAETLSCSGLSSIRIAKDVISVPVPIYEQSGGDQIRCDRRVRYLDEVKPFGTLEIEYLKQTSNGLRTTGRVSGNTLSLGEDQSAIFFSYNTRDDGRFERYRIITDSFIEGLRTDRIGRYEAIPTDSRMGPCFLQLYYFEGKLEQIYAIEETGGIPRAQCSTPIHLRANNLTLQINLDQADVDAVRFDKNGLYSGGGTIVYMSNAGATYECIDAPDCIHANTVHNGVPTQVSVKDKANVYIFGSEAWCPVRGESFDLHPNLVPKQLSLAVPCELKTAAGSFEKYPAGSVIRFNEDGKVIEKVQ